MTQQSLVFYIEAEKVDIPAIKAEMLKLSRGVYSDEAIAKGRLTEAAPDLLKALETLFDSYKALADSTDCGFWKAEDTKEGKMAMAAIAKARYGN